MSQATPGSRPIIARIKQRFGGPVRRFVGRLRRLQGFQAQIEIVRGAEGAEIGDKVPFVVRLRNVGTRRWPARGLNPVCVGYHWLTAPGEPFVNVDLLTPLPADVRPGEETVVECRVKMPLLPGDFLLDFSLLRRDVGWFARSAPSGAPAPCRVAGKIWESFDDYQVKWLEADLDRDYWNIVGPGSKDEYETMGRIKRDCLIELGLTPQSRVLDVGCGTGQLTQALFDYLTPRGLYYGTDIAAKAVAFCEKKYQRPNFLFLKSEMTRVPIEDQRFDVIALFSVFTHIYPDEIRALLEDLKRLLDDDGWILADLFVSEQVRTHIGERAMVVINPTHLRETFAAAGLRAELLDTREWSGDCQRATYRFTHLNRDGMARVSPDR